MELLKVSEVYGAKCDILKKDIYIAARSSNQTNSNITLTANKPITSLNLKLKQAPKYFFEIQVSILNKNGKTKQVGKITNTSCFLDIILKNIEFDKIILTMKNTTKEQTNIILKSNVA